MDTNNQEFTEDLVLLLTPKAQKKQTKCLFPENEGKRKKAGS